jgi:hypothetical protein
MVGWFQKDPNCLPERSTSHSEISQFSRTVYWMARKSQANGRLGRTELRGLHSEVAETANADNGNGFARLRLSPTQS